MTHRRSPWFVMILAVASLSWACMVVAQQRLAPNPPPPRKPPAVVPGAAPATRPAEASPATPQGVPIYPSIPNTYLLGLEPVQAELKITDEQKQKIRQLSDQYNKALQQDYAAMQQLGPNQEAQAVEIQQRTMKRQQAFQQQVEQVLQPEQLTQLRQLAFAMSIPNALGMPQIVESLKVTAEQQQQARKIREDAQAKIWQIQRQTAELLYKTLTPTQQQTLQVLHAQSARAGAPRAP